MHKGRIEAFSDGVVAILITIMVLELKIPHDAELSALGPLIPVLLSYVLSFVFIAIYWNNHHHLFQAAKHVNGRVLWANMHLLFWLSLVPFVTNWLGESGLEAWPVGLYGAVMWMAGFAYYLLVRALLGIHAKDSHLALAIGRDFKGYVSLVVYTLAVPLAFVNAWISCGLYVLVAIMWFVPDPRVEKAITPPSQ